MKITREEALDRYVVPALNRTWNEKTCKAIFEALERQTGEREEKWIPVSEKLPEDGTYLVTTIGRILVEPSIDIRSFAKDLSKECEFGFHEHKCGWYDYDSECGYWEDTGVIAWMPLPEPYEPQESEV